MNRDQEINKHSVQSLFRIRDRKLLGRLHLKYLCRIGREDQLLAPPVLHPYMRIYAHQPPRLLIIHECLQCATIKDPNAFHAW